MSKKPTNISHENQNCDESNFETVEKYGFSGKVCASSNTDSFLIKQKEHKWFEMLRDWDSFMTSNFSKVKVRCSKGIPHSLRAAAWQALSGSANLQKKNAGMFEDLLQKESESMVYIEKDIARAYRICDLFAEKNGLGQTELRKVLKAYSIYNPKVGYFNFGMTCIAGILLMLMPAEQAFWCLVSIINKYLPGYFSPGMPAVQVDCKVIDSLVCKVDPKIGEFLKRNDMEAHYYTIEWLQCAYTLTLPRKTVLRIWDMFLCEGVKVLIKAGVTLILLAFSDRKVREACDGLDKALEYLKYKLPHHLLEEDVFINKLLSLNISEEQFKVAHFAQLARLDR